MSLTTAHLGGELKLLKGHSPISAHASFQLSLIVAFSNTESVINNFSRSLCSVGCWCGDAGEPWFSGKVPENIMAQSLTKAHLQYEHG